MQLQQGTKGFTLIELMIVIAIIGILAAVAAPQYNTYQKRSKYSEVVLATTNYTTAAELAVQSGRVTQLSDLNNESNGIPAAISEGDAVGKYVYTVTVSSGVIVATGTTEVDSATYTLKASLVNGGIVWEGDDTGANACQKSGLC